jgi:hypothetical protein
MREPQRAVMRMVELLTRRVLLHREIAVQPGAVRREPR